MNETKGYLTLKDKSQIYYEISGSGDEILFLLHGNSGDLTYFDHQAAAFGKFFRIIRFDYRDHGKSVNAHSKLSFSILVEDLKEIFDYFCVKRADILGFSDGANLAVKFALACPEHVNHLILNAPNLKFEGLNFITQIAAIIWHRISKILPFMEKMHRVSGLLVEDLQVGEHDLSKIKEIWSEMLRLPYAINAYHNLLGVFETVFWGFRYFFFQKKQRINHGLRIP